MCNWGSATERLWAQVRRIKFVWFGNEKPFFPGTGGKEWRTSCIKVLCGYLCLLSWKNDKEFCGTLETNRLIRHKHSWVKPTSSDQIGDSIGKSFICMLRVTLSQAWAKYGLHPAGQATGSKPTEAVGSPRWVPLLAPHTIQTQLWGTFSLSP